MEYKNSIITDTPLIPLFNLGEFYVSDFLKPGENPKYPKCKLELGFDPVSKLVQLTEQPSVECMFGSMYHYYSHTNPIMQRALKDVADSLLSRAKKKEGIFLDIASNTFELTKNVPKTFTRVGIDPSDYYKFVDNEKVDVYIKDYFSATAFKRKFESKKADLISCAAMFYDTPEPVKFLQDVSEILADDGIFCLQVSYLPLNVNLLEFPVICHEHIAFYTFLSLIRLFELSNLEIRDIELNDVNAGSIRIYATKKSFDYRNFIEKETAQIRIDSLIDWEETEGYGYPYIYKSFYNRIIEWKAKVLEWMGAEKLKGKIIAGAGASTKSATILQTLNIDYNTISYISDRQKEKHGLRTIGSNIEIISEEELRTRQPDYLIFFPYFFINDFLEREKEYLEKGGKIVILTPEIRIYTKDGNYTI